MANPAGPDVFTATAVKIANAHDIAVTRIVQTRGAGASVRRGVIRYGTQLARLPVEFQAWTAAHELGHIAAGHHSTRSTITLVAGVGAALSAAAVSLMAIAWTDAPRFVAIAALASMIGGGVLFPVALVHDCHRWRLREVEADRLAHQWGYPLTPTIARHVRDDEPRITRWRIFRALREHPLPEDRITAAHARSMGSPPHEAMGVQRGRGHPLLDGHPRPTQTARRGRGAVR